MSRECLTSLMGGAGLAYTGDMEVGGWEGSAREAPGHRRWVACLAMGLPLLKASGAVGASPVLSDPFIRQVVCGRRRSGRVGTIQQWRRKRRALSDGNTALIGGGHAEWVYTRSGSTWTRQAKLNLGIRLAWRCRATGTRR